MPSNNDVNEIFSSNLNKWLNIRGKSQADLYRKMHVSSATASDWCNKKKMPRADKLVEISQWLMIELSDLLEDKKNEPTETDLLLYRLKDDEAFMELISDIYSLDQERMNKVRDYVDLLKK